MMKIKNHEHGDINENYDKMEITKNYKTLMKLMKLHKQEKL